MHTRCPECETIFLITEQQLRAAGGKARCGRCGAVFDARAALLTDADLSATAPASAPESSAEPDTAVAGPAARSEPASDATTAPDPIPAVLLADFEEQARPRRPRHGWAWALLAVALTAALGLQYVYFARAELVDRFPEARPWMVQLCKPFTAYLDCAVSYPTRLEQLRMLSSAVSEHPDKGGALLLEATFVNVAPFAQPYPLLEVLLTDLRGAPVALRRFRPAEYLPATHAEQDGMAPRTPVTALVEVVRPFADVNSYRFTFHRAVQKQRGD